MSLAGRTFGAVIFDLDNTLVDSEASIRRSWRQWAEEVGLTEDDFVGHNWHGRPARDVIALLLPDRSEEERAGHLARMIDVETADAITVTPLPGTVDALRALADVPVAIATSGEQSLATARIDGAGIDAPEIVISADMVTRGKPAPEPFLMAADRLGVEPTDCLVVEDAIAGVTAARAAGMACLAVLTTTAPELLNADLLVDDLSQVAWHVTQGRVSVDRRE